MRFGERIRDLRRKKRLSQKALAEMVGVSDAYLSKVENQRLDFGDFPSEKLIHKLADALDADETELLLLAEKVPPHIRQRFFERPDVFSQIAELDDQELDQLASHIGQKSEMKILFLHGWQSVPGGVKPTFFKDHGHTVFNPKLNDDDFDAAVQTAQAEFDKQQPDLIVGSSRGGAVAMNINSGDTPLVLLCPAWKRWGSATKLKPKSVILHSRADDVIPFADSEELVANSGLPASALIEVGTGHRLADPEPLKAMLRACERLTKKAKQP